ncbi:MAG: hypothetical protein ACM3S0_10455 [Acidobacteriota bacterium]
MSQTRHPAITAASVLCFIHGVGWPIGLADPIIFMMRYRTLQVRSLPGMREFRGLAGPFEVLGIDGIILLALVFCAINVLFILAGYWLWQSDRRGGILAFSLLAVSAVFWWGFGLPFPPVAGLLLAGLLATGWKSLGKEVGP